MSSHCTLASPRCGRGEQAQKVDAEHAVDPVSKVGNDHAMIGHRQAES
jgi:hypothetical protein